MGKIGKNFISGEIYENFLLNNFKESPEDVLITNKINMTFQNDKCPAHYYTIIRNFLDE